MDWNRDFEQALQCPNGTTRTGITANDPPAVGATQHTEERGSSIGCRCWFEQCHHQIEFRFRFHKGEVYFEWREVRSPSPVHPHGFIDRPEMPRT